MTVASLEPFLTTSELAELLRVPLATIYEWRRQNAGPRAHRVGKHLRYRVSDVEGWLEEQRDADDQEATA